MPELKVDAECKNVPMAPGQRSCFGKATKRPEFDRWLGPPGDRDLLREAQRNFPGKACKTQCPRTAAQQHARSSSTSAEYRVHHDQVWRGTLVKHSASQTASHPSCVLSPRVLLQQVLC